MDGHIGFHSNGDVEWPNLPAPTADLVERAKPDSALSERTYDMPRAKECPACHRVQLMALHFCGHCGSPFAVAVRAQAQEPLGAQLIAAERERQIMQEGWTDSHDDEHDGAEMAAAACCYGAIARRQADGTIRSRAENIGAPSGWPWEQAWWKPSDDPIRNLVKAGALIAAEIDRLNRLRSLRSDREREAENAKK